MDIDRKKVLIISRYFLPYFPSIGGVMRVYTLANFLINNGFEVYILTGTGKNYGYFGYENYLSQINIKYIGTHNTHTYSSRSFSRIVAWFSYIFSRLCIPDENIFRIKSFVREAENIISANGIKNVLISTPPHGMQVVGYNLKKKLGNKIKLIIDYRDSWNTTKIFKHKTYPGFLINKMIEKRILRSCDVFSYVSEPILNKIEKLYKLDIKKKSILVMNGFNKIEMDTQLQSVPIIQKIKIGYFGVLKSGRKSYRDISSLIEVLAENKSLAAKFEFYFFGSISIKHTRISDINNFHINPPVSHEEAINEMKKMDYLMIVHSDPESSDEVITGKFFEYVSVRKPIICLAPPDMEGGRLIESYGIGCHLNICDKEMVKSGLEQLVKPSAGNFYKDLDINIFSREVQYSKLLGYLT